MNADIRKLIVAHRFKTGARSSARSETAREARVPNHWAPNHRALYLDTCLRQLSIDLMPVPARGEMQRNGAEVRFGGDAYRFLLEITTGLRSAIPGETNVFGQFKNAWQEYRRDGPGARVTRLAPLIHRLSNDTKAIRQEHLQGIGGASYGSLVRRLIAPAPTDRVLIVGAGNLAQSMLPFFRNYALGIWNHRVPVNSALSADQFFPPEHGDRAATWADHVILTTPPDALNDANWIRWIDAEQVRTAVHLGHRRGDREMGPGVRYFDLDDVFALRRRQADLRSRQLVRAGIACRQLAASYLHDDERITSITSANLKTA